jgi:hypothetical protein
MPPWRRRDGANTSNFRKPLAGFNAAMPLLNLPIHLIHQLIECPQMFSELLQQLLEEASNAISASSRSPADPCGYIEFPWDIVTPYSASKPRV